MKHIRLFRSVTRRLIWLWLACTSVGLAQEARITVHAAQVVNRISRFLTGACLEDVNHECYGGLYSQMIFGESFQEPPPSNGPAGFRAYGGNWRVAQGVLLAEGGQGPKLISEVAPFLQGEVGVELRLADRSAGNGGLIVRVRHPGIGADRFDGYEISLDAARNVLVLGRHRQDWEPLREVPCPVPTNQWIQLAVRLQAQTIDVTVDGQNRLRYADTEHPLAAGRVGLRPWLRAVRYRNLWFKTNGVVHPLPFTAATKNAGPISGMWRAVHRGSAVGRYGLEKTDPFVGRQSQRVTFVKGTGEVGIENEGLNHWGLNFVQDRPYVGILCARAERPTRLDVVLESRDGSTVYAERTLSVRRSNWQRLKFRLRPNRSDPRGRFVIALPGKGSVVLGYVFLEPGRWGRFKGLPVRRDIAEALVRQGITVLRYGGSMVNAPGYRWKKMIGPRDRRPPYRGTWYPYSSNGWGILDFLNFCEAAHFLGVPAFNIHETPQDMADFIEYVNGPKDTPWGRRRATDGHPQPYHLRYLELGNEEAVNEAYFRRFKSIMQAIWAKDAKIIPVVGDFSYSKPIRDPFHFQGAPRIRSLAAHQKILEFAQRTGHAVWFDVHIGTDSPRDWEGLGGVPSFAAALHKIAPRAKSKVVVFEFNANHHNLGRALGNARAIIELEQMGNEVPIACSANCLQPDGQNDNGWNQGLLFFNPSEVWAQPPYYVTQMVSKNYMPLRVASAVTSPNHALEVTATRGQNGRELVIQVVNLVDEAMPTRIVVDGFQPNRPVARVFELTGPLKATNTAQHPDRIIPHERQWRPQWDRGPAQFNFPPDSFTILRLK